MSIQNLFKAIESFEFGARVGVASGFRTFGSIICNQSEVKQLRDCLDFGGFVRYFFITGSFGEDTAFSGESAVSNLHWSLYYFN